MIEMHSLHSRKHAILGLISLSQTNLDLTKFIENIVNFYSFKYILYENIFRDKPNYDYSVS